MKKVILITLISYLAFSCDTLDIPNGLPECIEDQIKSEVRNIQMREPNKASVEAYLYNGEKVYIFNPGSGYADWLSTAYSQNCEVICEFGGFAGLNTCPDFDETAETLGIIWEDPR